MASSTKSGWISWRLLNNFLFYRVGLLAPRQTPIPEDQASVFISPKGRVVTHFSRLLRHAWVTVGLFLFPGHYTGNSWYNYRNKFLVKFILYALSSQSDFTDYKLWSILPLNTFIRFQNYLGARNSSVSTDTRLRAGRPWFDSRQ
jgi:hypothetical protein